jgi:signal transduction histidine kinase
VSGAGSRRGHLHGGARGLASRLRYPRTTVRWRLTLLYAGLFLISGIVLLTITYELVTHATQARPATLSVGKVAADVAAATPAITRGHPLHSASQTKPAQLTLLLRSDTGRRVIGIAGRDQRTADLHQLEVESAIALALMTVLSAALGWLVAGRALRPIRVMTDTTREISAANLHRRLAVTGPPDELQTLANTIDGLLARLEGAFDAQRRFVANASHELRTPLTASRALLEMVASDPSATVSEFRTAVREALDESDHSEQLIDALLALAQGQQGLDSREPVSLTAITAAGLPALRAEAHARGLRCQSSLEPAHLEGQARLIERLVTNLVQNAIRHNTTGGTVEVTVLEHNGEATLRVANSGPLVPADEFPRLLAPFQRMNPERVGQPEGFGLGLSIVAAVATAHDAVLTLTPHREGGLNVEVRFPAPTPGSQLDL